MYIKRVSQTQNQAKLGNQGLSILKIKLNPNHYLIRVVHIKSNVLFFHTVSDNHRNKKEKNMLKYKTNINIIPYTNNNNNET